MSASIIELSRSYLLQVFEAFGQTETTSLATFTLPGEWLPGHVGVPMQCNAIKLTDLPEHGYLARERRGERYKHQYFSYSKDCALIRDSNGMMYSNTA